MPKRTNEFQKIVSLQRYLVIFSKLEKASLSMRQVSAMVACLYPNDLFKQVFKRVPFHRQNDFNQGSKYTVS